MKSNQKNKPNTKEHISRRTVQKSCFKCDPSWLHRSGECPAKEKNLYKMRKTNHFAEVCKSININVVNYEDGNTLEYINSRGIPSSKTSMQNSKVE